jgi:RNA polymerase sigma-70 factor (ECF subfamily)
VPDPSPASADAVGLAFRAESGRVVASLARYVGDVDLAEEAVQEAFAIALERWPADGVPANPGAWITTTAKRRALDHLRREAARRRVHDQAELLMAPDGPREVGAVRDDLLRLVFTCCHPALAREAQVALTLRLVGGLQTPAIARAFLVPEATLAQRIVRAKRKIAAAKIPYRVPEEHELPERLQGVLAVVYLIYTEGHTASAGPDLTRDDPRSEAIRLARLLAELMPDEEEVLGLLALLLLTEARAPARTDADGGVVLLADQDRALWDAALVREGQALVRTCLRRNRPGPYQLQAAIAAVHSDAPSAAGTDWAQVLALYDHLMRLAPTPVVALNRAVALAEVAGPAAALAEVDRVGLDRFHLARAARADLLRRLGRPADAAAEYRAALLLTANEAEQAFLRRRLAELG